MQLITIHTEYIQLQQLLKLARETVSGGGVKVNEEKVASHEQKVSDFTAEKEFVLHKGKKVHLKIMLRG